MPFSLSLISFVVSVKALAGCEHIVHLISVFIVVLRTTILIIYNFSIFTNFPKLIIIFDFLLFVDNILLIEL